MNLYKVWYVQFITTSLLLTSVTLVLMVKERDNTPIFKLNASPEYLLLELNILKGTFFLSSQQQK